MTYPHMYIQGFSIKCDAVLSLFLFLFIFRSILHDGLIERYLRVYVMLGRAFNIACYFFKASSCPVKKAQPKLQEYRRARAPRSSGINNTCTLLFTHIIQWGFV